MTRQTRMWAVVVVVAAGVSLGLAGTAAAQGNGKLPFSNIYSRPAVSPYTLMGNPQSPMTVNNQTGAVANNSLIYQQIIQPQLQQQQQVIEQQSQTRQLGRLQNQVQQIQRDTTSRQVDETIRPTGHASTYQNLSHFYPRR
ncbi:MAG: hypothetical protein WCR51_01340 [Planctomycetia bacterium]